MPEIWSRKLEALERKVITKSVQAEIDELKAKIRTHYKDLMRY